MTRQTFFEHAVLRVGKTRAVFGMSETRNYVKSPRDRANAPPCRAAWAGVDLKTVGKLCRGDYRTPELETLCRVAASVGVAHLRSSSRYSPGGHPAHVTDKVLDRAATRSRLALPRASDAATAAVCGIARTGYASS